MQLHLEYNIRFFPLMETLQKHEFPHLSAVEDVFIPVLVARDKRKLGKEVRIAGNILLAIGPA